MSDSKRLKRSTDGDDDDIILFDPISTNEKSSSLHYCRHKELNSEVECHEYLAAICVHCNLHLCYKHLELHRFSLMMERDLFIDEINERIALVDQWKKHPEQLRNLLIDNHQLKLKKNISFLERVELEKLINLQGILNQLKILFEPIKRLLCQQHCISPFQIKKIQEVISKYDEEKLFLLNQFIDSNPMISNSSMHFFQFSDLSSACRVIPLTTQRSFTHEMAASSELLLVNDRDHLLFFHLTRNVDENSIPELIEWKWNLDGKILDMCWNMDLNLFLILTEMKLFSFRPPNYFHCLLSFTSILWSCTSAYNSIYLLPKYSLMIEQWTFNSDDSSMDLQKQWKWNEISKEDQCDQHFRCIRVNPSQTQLSILIEDDECRWRIGIFDLNLNLLAQSLTLENASTLDWNLLFSYVNDRQLLIMDSTTNNNYLMLIDGQTFSVERENFLHTDLPVNVCTIKSGNNHQLIFKSIRPDTLKFCQI